mgnify:CR=1 FL=1
MALSLPDSVYLDPADSHGKPALWDSHLVLQHLLAQQTDVSLRTAERAINEAKLVPTSLKLEDIRDEHGLPLNHLVRDNLVSQAKQQRQPSLVIRLH